jgi:hypothetical protein
MPRWLFSQDTCDCQATALRVAVQMCGKEEPLPSKKIPCGSQQSKTAQMVLSSLYISAVFQGLAGPRCVPALPGS